VELGDRHSGIKPLKEAKEGTGFAKSWDGWLKQVSLQVHAAVDLARGLPAAKKERLDGILGNDVVRLRLVSVTTFPSFRPLFPSSIPVLSGAMVVAHS